MMKATILERYMRTDTGDYVIDISAGKINDLYNDYDSHTPYVRKELNQDLAEYITDSASELGKESFVIRFDLLDMPDESMRQRITTSIHSYFLYLRSVQLHKMARSMRNSFIFLLLGLVILSLAVWVNQLLAEDASVVSKVFAEGLTVAAWVSLWEALATFLVNWAPDRRRIKLYERIAHATVLFRNSEPASASPV